MIVCVDHICGARLYFGGLSGAQRYFKGVRGTFTGFGGTGLF